ncbi:Mov34/MPN/PAD-1 family protein [Pseudomonas putida]|uniref:Mov34/MPN/PAD-1 family protein n=1 Tax=Pseudomonas TaxID=286 RepID=UPI0006996672|nr:Mov34/MPN/PAD-1 family protein [Pseudomonas putida]
MKYDEALVQKLLTSRLAALPNETGGAILGVTDLKTKTIVIVDVLPAPPDSEASPSHFIRGQVGQAEALGTVHSRTARVVDYVGEWHSHPDNCPARPSQLDEHLLDTLHRKMSAEGLPALMVIASKGEVAVFVR